MLKHPDLTKQETVEEVKVKTVGLFDYIKMITQTKEIPTFDEQFNKTYVPFIVNKGLANYIDLANAVNWIQMYNPTLTPQQHFLFLHALIPKKNRGYVKWAKKEKVTERLQLIMDVYNINESKARAVQDLFGPKAMAMLKEMQSTGGKMK